MVAFGIERAISLRRKRVLPPAIVSRVRAVIASPGGTFNAGSLQSQIEVSTSPLSRILCAGLRKTGRPVADVEKAIQYAGEREVGRLRRNGRVLSVVAGVAPLLGLLGTVFGMIQAFITVASREEALGRTELLAEGIYQALVTTAVGLSVAIPALVLYHIFAEKADRLVAEMDDIAIELVDRLALVHEQAGRN
jgi:biopolymer transport protein ExbB